MLIDSDCLFQEINQFRMNLATLFVYDMISMPLVYTQVSDSETPH